MKNYLIIYIFLAFGFLSVSQNTTSVDSLFNYCLKLKKDNSNLFPSNAHVLYEKTRQLNLLEPKLKIENLIGIYYTINQVFDSGFVYFSAGLQTAGLLKDTLMQVSLTMNIGIVLRYQKNFSKAEKYFLSALKQSEKLENIDMQIKTLYNISGLYLDMGRLNEAISINRKSYNLALASNDVEHQIKSLEAIGSNYSELKQTDSAKHYLLLAYEKAKYINYSSEQSYLCNNIGGLYLQLKDYKAAENFMKQAQLKAVEMKNKHSLISIYSNLKQLYLETKQYEKCVFYFNKADSFKTAIYNEDILNRTTEMEAKYETEKKDLQIETANTHILLEEEKNQQKEKVIWFGALALLITLILGTLAYFNFRKFKKANKTINSQNITLSVQKKEVEEQKHLVEEKQKEIIDSINYAKRIQSAVLTHDDVWTKVSPEHFVLFKPKDIVSGDFYWAYNTPNNRSVFALADCTGHGVPGGFMSMLGNSFLNEIVIENKIFSAPTILNKLREKIINALDQKGNEEQKDGMDIALCVWNKLNNTLEYAGANNALMLVRDNNLTELKPDKMPIGKYLTDTKTFNGQTIQLQPGDCLYMSTDGFPDQFGGPKGKKLKHKQLENLILEFHSIPMVEQLEALTNSFLDWKGDLEQIDDIAVIGVRV